MNKANQGAQNNAPSYKETLNLLQTQFGMRANATLREPELQAFWSEKKIDFDLGLDAFLARGQQLQGTGESLW